MPRSSISPIRKIVGAIQPFADDNGIPVYIGRLPKESHEFISVSRGQSPGILHGYGNIAYMYTTTSVVSRSRTYSGAEDLLINIILALLNYQSIWISAISPAQTKNAGDVECVEITITVEMLERVR